MLINIDHILDKLEEEKALCRQKSSELWGKETMIDKLIDYYTELKKAEEKDKK